MLKKVFKCLFTMMLVITLSGCTEQNNENHTVSFVTNSESVIDNQIVINNEKIIEPQDPIKEGFTFDGWYLDNGKWDFNNVVSEDIVLTAKWIDIATVYFNVEFESNNKSEIQSQKILYGNKALEPENLVKEGYEFIGWFYGVDEWNFTDFLVKNNIKLVGKWKPIEYSISYNLNDGINNIDNPTIYTTDDEILLSNPSKVGYTFTGWTEKDNETPVIDLIINKGNIEDKVYIANWIPTEYEITYELFSCGQPTAFKQTIKYNDKIVMFTPARDGFIFDGWYYNDVKFTDSVYNIASDITLVASWIYPFKINKANDGYEILGLNVPMEEVIIPSSIEGINVVAIKDEAFKDNLNITKVVIPSTVTNIGDYVFYNCSNLESVELPPSLTVLGDHSFYNCSNLESVELPPSLTVLGDYSFYNCSSLKSIELPSSLSTLGDYSFYNCSNLRSIELPSSLTSISDATFYNCLNLVEVKLPSTITSIGKSAFYHCISLTDIVIPQSVTGIGDFAFSECFSLIDIKLPMNVKKLGNDIFGGCYILDFTVKDGLKYLGNSTNPYLWLIGVVNQNITSVTILSNVKCISDNIFFPSHNITKINVESGNTVYDSRDNCNGIIQTETNTLISGCKNTTIPLGVTTIGRYAFYNLPELLSISLPDSVTNIEEYAFNLCTNLETIKMSTNVRSIGDFAFYNCFALRSNLIPFSVTTIGDSTFSNCINLTSIKIPSNTTKIGKSAFSGCNNLIDLSVNRNNKIYDSRDNCNAIIETSTNALICGCNNTIIPSSVTSIGDSAFKDLSNIKSIQIPLGVTSIGEYAFRGCVNLKNVDLTSNLTSIGDFAFYYNNAIDHIYIPSSVNKIGKSAFGFCNSLQTIIVDEKNNFYDSRDNCNGIIETLTNTLISGCNYTIIPLSVTKIGDYAFDSCFFMKKLTIPENVTYIGNNVFNCCFYLESIEIPSSLISIGDYAFAYCRRLVNMNLPSGLVSIGDYAFTDCESLENIIIPESVTFIGNSAFDYCKNLVNIDLPSGLVSIGDYAFYSCESLESVELPSSIITIGDYAFGYCENLKNINLSSNLVSIGNYAFIQCGSLKNIIIPKSVTYIGIYTFVDCKNLQIKCVASSQPDGWSLLWNQTRCEVEWKYR